MRRIGIDVGGTNTDAVLIEGSEVVRWCKTPTTEDVTQGIRVALATVLEPDQDGGSSRAAIDAVMIGTTHFTNAVVERRELDPVAAVRIGLPASASLPPFVDWPSDLAELVRGGVFLVAGGHEYDGRPIVPFDAAGMRSVAERIADSSVRSVAISSVFSPLTSECEEAAAEIVAQVVPGARVTLSHALGRIGLLERENATILNATLRSLADRTLAAFERALVESGLDCPLFVTLNDGTVARSEMVARFPVLSFASGPTNSMRGAAFLTGMSDALVVDVGGTTTDIGALVGGFPREANSVVEVGGVRTLFRMPDLLSIGLGGGSIVSEDGGQVGPTSVGFRIQEEALVFGGDTLTASDVAVALGWTSMGDGSHVAGEPRARVERAAWSLHTALAEAVDRMKTDARPEPLIAVGGGAFLVPERMDGISEVVRVPHQGVANAVGAAIAQVSGEVDRIFQGVGREGAIVEATALANERAMAAGAAASTLRVVDLEDLPLAYLPGDALRVRVKVVGDVGQTVRV
ncbi:MAG: hydantoinase/oxoprolinase family protein [Gemmatimonadota bacterium]